MNATISHAIALTVNCVQITETAFAVNVSATTDGKAPVVIVKYQTKPAYQLVKKKNDFFD